MVKDKNTKNVDKVNNIELGVSNSEISDKSLEILKKFKKRFEAMNMARESAERERKYADEVIDKVPEINGSGLIIPNMSIEQALIETYMGTIPSGLPIKVATKGRPDGILTELSKQLISHFIKNEKIITEIKLKGDYEKAKYGTAVYFSGLTMDSKFIAEKGNSYYESGKMKKIDQYHIKIKKMDCRDCWFDDVEDYDDAIDCIFRETISEEEFKARFFDEKGKPIDNNFINLDYVKTTDNIGDKTIKDNVVELYHYFNKVYGYYRVVANKSVVIYDGFATTKHGELPLIPIQHYYNDKRIWGDGIVKRYAVVKAINNNLLTDIIGGSRINASSFIVKGAGVETTGEIYADPGEIGIIEMTNGNVRDIMPMNMQVNTAQLKDTLVLLDDYGIILTGLNFKAPYSSPAKTAFETSVMKEEQNNRLKNPSQIRDLGLSRAFTLLLCNIFQYAPYLYTEKIRDDETKKSIRKDGWYVIPVKNKKIVWKGKEDKDEKEKKLGDIIDLQDIEGYEDYFEFSNKFFDNDKLLNAGGMLKVYIETPSNPNTMKTLEIENFVKYINTKLNIVQAKAQAQQMGNDISSFDNIEKKMDELFDIDPDNVRLKSNGERFKEKFEEINNLILGINTGTLQSNITNNETMGQNQGANPQPNTQEQSQNSGLAGISGNAKQIEGNI